MVPPNISASDREQIEKLRSLIKDEISPYYNTDFNLLRWLTGHNYNTEEILPKLKNHLALRRSNFQLDSIADQPRSHPVHQYWKSGLTTMAVKTPDVLINIEQSGTNDYWGILHSFPLNEIMKARIYDLECMLRAVMEHEKKTGNQMSVMYVMDLTGLHYDRNLLTLVTGALASISSFMSEHYVEMIHTFVLVNAPSFISTIWAIAKPILPERTKNKVKILGNNWREEILALAVPEALPAFWNELGKEWVFLADVERSISLDPNGYYKGEEMKNADCLSISAGKTGFITVTVQKGQKLNWHFETDGRFAYGIYFSENGDESDLGKMRLVYPRFNNVPGPTFVPITDYLICTQSGTYKFWFSNQHAWIHTLKINHKIEVISLE